MNTRQDGKFMVIDPGFPEDFTEAENESLGYPFEQFPEFKCKCLIVIPVQWCDGKGKGYLADLMEMLGDRASVHMMPLHRWGVPINELICVLANFNASKELRGTASKGMTKGTIGFLRHNEHQSFRSYRHVQDTQSQEFILSAGKLFEARWMWQEPTPLVLDKKKHNVRSLNEKEKLSLFGGDPHLTMPNLMFERIAKKINLDK